MMTEEIQKRFEKLQPLPDSGWDTSWVDRVRTFADFESNGQNTADFIRKLQVMSPSTYEKDFRSLAPELHDFLLEVFPKGTGQETI